MKTINISSPNATEIIVDVTETFKTVGYPGCPRYELKGKTLTIYQNKEGIVILEDDEVHITIHDSGVVKIKEDLTVHDNIFRFIPYHMIYG